MAGVETKCSIGVQLNIKCEIGKNATEGLTSIIDFDEEKKDLLYWRSGLSREDLQTVCSHHEKMFLTGFESSQRKCCDPFSRHKTAIRASLRIISINFALRLKCSGVNVKPGEKLCTLCRKSFGEIEDNSPDSDNTDDTDFKSTEHERMQLDDSITKLGCSPIKVHGIKDRKSYGKRKILSLQEKAAEKVANVLQIPVLEFDDNVQQECTDCTDLTKLIQELKIKCSTSSRKDKVKLLTLAPGSWSIDRVASEFNVTHYLVKKSRELYRTRGILADPSNLHGKTLSEETVNAVKLFYEDDEFSRMCPGKKDFLSVKERTGRVHKQKRLLLTNIKEMHVEFKKRTNHKIGLSKFCELRPPWCVTVDSSGMHSVCVCQTHQNLQLLISVLPKRMDCTDIFLSLVCSLDSRECMMHRCTKCQGRENLKQFIESLFENDETDLDDTIRYKQWCRDGQLTIQTLLCTVSEYIDILCDAADSATSHHYTCKSQSQYLRQLKECLPANSVIILLDFAENYSFICQDATQGFHWNTEQATLHPFAIYYRKDSEELACLSLCIISDEREHLATTVYCFIRKVLTYLKEYLPNMDYVHYFSDGASSQYKNCKNLCNLCHHENDFNIKAEWNFFATSHGKSPCDGIGGTVKRLAARASLQAANTGQILTPSELFDWAVEHIKGITFFYVPTEGVQDCSKTLTNRFKSLKTVAGTRSHHRFVPISSTEVNMHRLSNDVFHTTVAITADVESDITISIRSVENIAPGQYVAAVYDAQWYIGIVIEQSYEHGDVVINFMKRNAETNVLTWPSHKDECAVLIENILRVIPAPVPVGGSGRQYKLAPEVITSLLEEFKTHVSK